MSRTRAALLGTLSSQVYALISLLVSLFAAPVILRHLQAEIYGLSIIIFQVTAYLGMFDFGLTAGVQRFLDGHRGHDDESRTRVQQIISTAFIVYTVIGLVAAITGLILSPYASLLFDIPPAYQSQVQSVIIVVSILIGLQFLLRAISGIFFAHQKQILSNTLSFVINILNTALIIIFINMGFELWSFVYTQVFVFSVNAFLNLYFFKKYYSYFVLSFKNFDFGLLKQMFSYGFFIFLVGISVQIVFYTDRIIIGSMISLTAVSIYSFTAKMPELLTQILWKITDNSFPGMVELAKNDRRLFKEVHDKIMRLTISLSTTGFWIILISSYPFIRLWVGKEFYAGLMFTTLVTYLYLIQHSFIHVSSACLNGAGIAKSISFMALLEGAVNLALSILLVRSFGLTGVVAATVAASLVTSFWYIPYLSVRYMKTSYWSYISCLLQPILICSAFDGILFLLLFDAFQKIDGWLALIASVAGFSLICCIPLFLLNKKLILELRNKISGVSQIPVAVQPLLQAE